MFYELVEGRRSRTLHFCDKAGHEGCTLAPPPPSPPALRFALFSLLP